MFERLRELRAFKTSKAYQDLLVFKSVKEKHSTLKQEIAKDFTEQAFVKAVFQHSTLLDLKNKITGVETELSLFKDKSSFLSKQLQSLASDKINRQYLIEFYRDVLTSLTEQHLDQLSGTLSSVYSSVYETENKRVRLVMEDYRGKKVIRLKIVNVYDGKEYEESLDNDGGSAQIILGSVIALYFIIATGLPRIMFFDESVSALSTPKLRSFLSVLKEFSEKLDFVFVFVEHAAYRMTGYIDQLFTISNGVYKEVPAEEIEDFVSKTQGVKC